MTRYSRDSQLEPYQVTWIAIVSMFLLFGVLIALIVTHAPYHAPTPAQVQQQIQQQQQIYDLQKQCATMHGKWSYGRCVFH